MPAPSPMLNAGKFEEMIDRRGRMVEWQEARICSCWNESSGQPQYDCAACHGIGYVYQPVIVAKALVTSVVLNQNWEAMAGVFEVGDAVATIPKRIPIRNDRNMPTGNTNLNPLFEVGVNDRVVLTDDEYKTTEILARNMGIGHREADTLLNEYITRIKAISTYDTQTGTETIYELGADYTLDKNRVVWVSSGKAPEEFKQYSVTYFHKPVYTVIANLPKPRHQDGQDFPKYVALRYISGAVDRQ